VNYVYFHGLEPSNDVIEFELIVGEGDSRIVNGHTSLDGTYVIIS
jgi:hypothetical protein